jgi:hypothetical protein
MIGSVLFLGILIFVGVIAFKKLAGTSGSKSVSPIRSFFQYGLLFALTLIVASGVAGLLGRLINPADLVVGDDNALALNLTFVVVGTPLLLGIASWTRKSVRANPQLTHEPLAAFFATLGALLALLMSLSSWITSIQSAFHHERFDGQSLANAIVWTLIWAALWMLNSRMIPKENARVHHLVGSLIGYITAIIGLITLIAATLSQLVGVEQTYLANSVGNRIADAFVISTFGAIVWVQYWVRTARKSNQDSLWLSYVLIAGVGGGLVMAVVAASTVLYSTAVWFIGEPSSSNSIVHFAGTPTAVGTVVIGLLSWWYHMAQLPETEVRNEVVRIYEYLIAGIGLIASAVGLSMILIAILEAIVGSGSLAGKSATNTFLAAATLILVGAPVWLIYWRGIQKAVKADSAAELASPTRRIYLFILFGIGGIAAIISLLVGVYQVFNDLFANSLGSATVRDMRFAIGVLVSTAIVSAYHWEIYRHERETDVTFGNRNVSVLLVGPKDKEFEQELGDQTGARITSWTRTDSTELAWPIDRVVAAINDSESEQLLILLESTGLKIVPVEHK